MRLFPDRRFCRWCRPRQGEESASLSAFRRAAAETMRASSPSGKTILRLRRRALSHSRSKRIHASHRVRTNVAGAINDRNRRGDQDSPRGLKGVYFDRSPRAPSSTARLASCAIAATRSTIWPSISSFEETAWLLLERRFAEQAAAREPSTPSSRQRASCLQPIARYYP